MVLEVRTPWKCGRPGLPRTIAAGPRVASRLNREDDSTITYVVGFVVFIALMCSHSLLLRRYMYLFP